MNAAAIFLVTDPAYDDDEVIDVVEAVGRALPAGVFAVQLRDKVRERARVARFAERLRRVTRDVEALLVVNGDPALASQIGADGVHLGREAPSVAEARAACGAAAWVSVAAHSDEAVRLAVQAGADAALVCPVFPTEPVSEMRLRVAGPRTTPTKTPRGVGAIASARALAPRPFKLFALGGVHAGNAGSCVDAGADGVALIRALLGRGDPAEEAARLWRAIRR